LPANRRSLCGQPLLHQKVSPKSPQTAQKTV
jgi:hypothetical protein